MLQKKVTVTEKGMATVDFAFEAPKGRRSVHEIEENPHYGPESLGEGRRHPSNAAVPNPMRPAQKE